MIFLKRAKWIFRLFLASLLAALQAQDVASQESSKPPDELHQLWSTTIAQNLRRNVQSADEAYNDGYALMVPVHAAFRLRDEEWGRAFADHFTRLTANSSGLPEVVLSRLQYLYVASQFLVLAKQNKREDLIPSGLPDLLFSQVRFYWQTKPAWQWGRDPFPGAIHERILWKLDNLEPEKHYYRSIVDEDLYALAIGADLKVYGGTPAQQKAWNPTLEEILSVAFRVFSQEIVSQPGGGWLFQPGAFSDHPDDAYAGNKEIRPDMKPAPVADVAEDSSHAHRFPLWLTSFMQAYPKNTERHRFYLGLRGRLEKQFFNKVLVKPTKDFPSYRLNNFMDGSNGVYRWNYESLGSGNGYGPYGVSGAMLLGWWVFLDTDRVRALYRDLSATFPWSKECVELYLGPTPTHTHPASALDPQSSSMRLWHILVQLAPRV